MSALAGVGNLLSILTLDNITLLSLSRFIAGLGAGGMISITFAMMGLTKATDRNLASSSWPC